MNKDLNNAMMWLRGNEMVANPAKYQALRLCRNIECCKNTIPLSNEIKILGVTIDVHIALNRLANILLVETWHCKYRPF